MFKIGDKLICCTTSFLVFQANLLYILIIFHKGKTNSCFLIIPLLIHNLRKWCNLGKYSIKRGDISNFSFLRFSNSTIPRPLYYKRCLPVSYIGTNGKIFTFGSFACKHVVSAYFPTLSSSASPTLFSVISIQSNAATNVLISREWNERIYFRARSLDSLDGRLLTLFRLSG